MENGAGKKEGSKFRKFLKGFWFLLWKDNSFKGWIFSLLIIFVFIRFVFFPLLGLVSGSSLPLAIVESCSMYHRGDIFSNFSSWWQSHELYYERWNITLKDFENFRFENGFDKGDILFLVGVKPQDVRVGDIIVFNAGQSTPVIHRVMNISYDKGTYYFSTMGDNNLGQQLSFENGINQDQVVGKAVFKIAPFLGWAKLIFFQYQLPPAERGLCVGR